MIVYVSIGNSDDKLTQAEWSRFWHDVDAVIRASIYGDGKRAVTVHGAWQSVGTDRWQNACWCIDSGGLDLGPLKNHLRAIAGNYRQDSIAWAQVKDTEFLGADSD